MRNKKLAKKSISAVLAVLTALFCITGAGAVTSFETADGDSVTDIAWLTDLIVKEDMSTVTGLSDRAVLIPVSDYEYTETAKSFERDIAYYTSLYLLREGSGKAGYLYLFSLLSSAGTVASDISDADVRDYLEFSGIEYPDTVSDDTLIVARALYTAAVTGAFTIPADGSAGLEQLAISYLCSLTGADKDTLAAWVPSGSLLSLDEYVLASSKAALWSNGYDVSTDTPENEVYRLVALMTIEKLGITADKSLSFDELKVVYMAAMLGLKYSVTADASALSQALADDTVAMYVLTLIGRKNGISVKSGLSLEQAFELICKNTSAFAFEEGEFYADISEYDCFLKGEGEYIWIMPTAYVTGMNGYSCIITADGQAVTNNFYSKIRPVYVNGGAKVNIKVVVSAGTKTSVKEYRLNVFAGAAAPEDENTDKPASPSYANSSTVVIAILSSMGLDSSIASVLSSAYVYVPSSFRATVASIAPTFGDETAALPEASDDFTGMDAYISALDSIGEYLNSSITGINGISIDAADESAGFVTFG